MRIGKSNGPVCIVCDWGSAHLYLGPLSIDFYGWRPTFHLERKGHRERRLREIADRLTGVVAQMEGVGADLSGRGASAFMALAEEAVALASEARRLNQPGWKEA